MLRTVLLAAALTLANSSLQGQGQWAVFKHKYNKEYEPHEDVKRQSIFQKNLELIEKHNEKFAEGQVSYYLGVNQFTDMTYKEFKKSFLGIKSMKGSQRRSKPQNIDVSDLPDTVDWRDKGYVTKVKNQGTCGSCWAFSTTGSLEGQHFKATGQLVSLSESNLVDCSWAQGNQGCQGGWMFWAFDYIIQNKGIDTEDAYPYVAKNLTCKFKAEGVGATMSSYKNVSSGSESALQKAVAEIGPISVAINVDESFMSYHGGVYDSPDCLKGWDDLNHAVLVVGYGTDDGKDYWLVKNSWGESWGVDGYIKMSRNKDDQCGIAMAGTYPVV